MSNSQQQPPFCDTWTARRCELHSRTWDGETFVVFHVPSGQTNVMGRLAMEVLRRLQDQRMTLDELMESLSEAPSTRGQLTAVPEILAHFDDLGLIQKCDPVPAEQLVGY